MWAESRKHEKAVRNLSWELKKRAEQKARVQAQIVRLYCKWKKSY